jgi:hypothetical protein
MWRQLQAHRKEGHAKPISDQLIRLTSILAFQIGIREQTNSYNISGCNISKKKPLRIHRHKWEDNTKVEHKNVRYENDIISRYSKYHFLL